MSGFVDELTENKSLKDQIKELNYDYTKIIRIKSDTIAQENMILRNLLVWTLKYLECRSRALMEADGYEFPPVLPGMSPENDWYTFENWINGRPTSAPVSDMLFGAVELKDPKDLSDEEIELQLDKIYDECEKYRIIIDLNDDIPPRLEYEYLLEALKEDTELIKEGNMVISGCTGYCPECFQRLWCDQGTGMVQTEDEEEGKIYLCDMIKRYASPAPGSLAILKERDDDFETDQK